MASTAPPSKATFTWVTLFDLIDAVAPLPEPFERWFASRGWAPRAHQLELLAKARAGRSVLLIAPTGAGKTLAGFLPSLVELSSQARGMSTTGRQARPAPSPLAGEGWGGGWQQTQDSRSPPSLSLPRKGGGNDVSPHGSPSDSAAATTQHRRLISTGRDLRREGGLHTLYISPLKAL